MHLTRYPTRHAGLIHYSLKSYIFKYNCVYTSLVLALGFKEHHTDGMYLLACAEHKSLGTCILLINSGAHVWYGFFEQANTRGTLRSILAGMTTSRIMDTMHMHTRPLIGNEHVREMVDAELARRQTLIN